MLYTVILFIIVLTFLYYSIVKHLSYWKRNGVPQYNIPKILQENLDVFIQRKSQVKLFKCYHESFSNDRYFGVYQLFKKYLVVQDPDLIKNITAKHFDHFTDHSMFGQEGEPLWDRNLFALQGTEWKEMRVIVSPIFTSSKMKMMFESLLNFTDKFVQHFQEKSDMQLSIPVNVKEAYNRFFTDIIASIGFGYSCNSLKEPNNEFYVNSRLAMPSHDFIDKVRMFLVFNLPRLAKLLGFRYFPKAGSDFFFNIISNNVKERERTGIVRQDLIHLLMEANKNPNNKNITDLDITAQALVFFFAGVDTMSTFLTFMTYELAMNKDIQKRLQNEVDKTLKKCKGRITYTALHEMEYMDMVVSESLRKWSPAITDRQCTKPYVIQPKNHGEVHVHIKKGDVVWFLMHGIHRNPKLYPNPERFDPERFSKQNKTRIHKYALIPFGAGPRKCVSYRFALMEIKLLILQILSKFDIETASKTIDPHELIKLSGLSIAIDEFWLGLKGRANVLP